MAIYYCHKCSQRCSVEQRGGGEVQCSRCRDTFVEELPAATTMDSPTTGGNQFANVPMNNNPFDMFPTSPFSRLFGQMIRQRGQEEAAQAIRSAQEMPGGSNRNVPHIPSSASSSRQPPPQQRSAEADGPDMVGGDETDPMINLLQQIFLQMVGQQENTGASDAGAAEQNAAEGEPNARPSRFSIRFITGPSGTMVMEGVGPFVFPQEGDGIHGNMGDYAWGPNGLDNVLTALLNQFDQAQERQRALRPEDIKRVPMTKVTQKHVDNGTQCTTCMEAFQLNEEVAKLNCGHIFHKNCIVPWLGKNNTCPICRAEVDPSKWGPEIADVDELD